MAKTVGDTSPTHATARFIAVDEDAAQNAGSVNAKLAMRLARNSNWQEAKFRRMFVNQPFMIDERTNPTTRSANPFDHYSQHQITHRSTEWVCFGPWKINATRPQIKCQFGFGLYSDATNGNSAVNYYFELKSQNRTAAPNSDEYFRVENATGAPAWYDGDIQTLDTTPGVEDWLCLWVRVEPGEKLFIKGDEDGIIEDADNEGVRLNSDGAGTDCNFASADFVPVNSKSFIVYDTTTYPIPAGTPILRGPVAIREISDRDGDGTYDWLEFNEAHAAVFWGTTESAEDMIGYAYEIVDTVAGTDHANTLGGVAMRYVNAWEEELTSVAEASMIRGGFTPMKDQSCYTGERNMRSIVATIGSNADIIYKAPEMIVNQMTSLVYDKHWPGRWRRTWTNGSGWKSLGKDDDTIWGFYAEHGLDKVIVRFAYKGEAGSSDNASMEARIRLLNDSGATVLTSDTQSFQVGMMPWYTTHVEGVGHYDEAYLPRSGGDRFWRRRWWNGDYLYMSPPFELDVSSHTGTDYAIDVQCQDSFDDANIRVSIYLYGMYIEARVK